MGLFDKLLGPPNIEKLKQAGDIGGLINALCHRDHNVRREAARSLGSFKEDNRILEPLIAALRDKDDNVRWEAAKALSKTNTVRSVLNIIVDPIFSQNALAGVGYLGCLTVAALLNAKADTNPEVSTAVAKGIGKLNDPRFLALLIRYVSGALHRYDPARYLLIDPHRRLPEAAKKLIEAAIEPLTTALKGKDDDARRETLSAFGELRDRRGLEPVIEILTDTTNASGLRMEAAKALQKMEVGGSRAVEVLCSAMRDSDIGLRNAAKDALAYIKDPSAIESLIATLKNEDSEVRQNAAWVLGSHGVAARGNRRAVEALVAALRDKDKAVQDMAVWALKLIGGPEAERALEERSQP